jgi:hypothetical protein
MRPPVYSSSLSLHRLYCAANITQPVIREWVKCVPFLRPCYYVGDTSSRATISIMRENRIPMICDKASHASMIADHSLVIEGRRFGANEYIARNVKDAVAPALASPRAPALASPRAPALASPRAPASPPLWVRTSISSAGIESAREMFEHIWAHKLILNGIVFDTRNFSNKNAAIPPSMYSYKIAFDFLFRNMIEPFKREYGIHTPCIMIDGRGHITRPEHLHELRHSAFDSTTSSILNVCKESGIEMRLLVDSLLDRPSAAS